MAFLPVPLRGSVRTVGQFACYQVGPWAGQDLEYCTTELLWHSGTNNHHLNTPTQHTVIFKAVKTDNFCAEKLQYFSYFCSKHVLLVYYIFKLCHCCKFNKYSQSVLEQE